MRQSRMFIGMAVLLAVFVAGCAHKGPVLIDFKYQLPSTLEAPKKVTVGVSPFKDDRGKSDSVIGKRFLELSDQTSDLVVQGTAASKVSAALKNAMLAHAIGVQDAPAWNLTDTSVPAAGTDLVVSGEIKSLWVESTSKLANTVVKADVQLRVVVADTAQKKIIRILNLNSKLERQTAIASPLFVGKILSEALTAAIDQIFTDSELKSRLK